MGKPTKDSTTGELIHKFKVTSGGALTCTSGSIAGWSIGTSSLKSPADKDGNQTIINSNGSLQHKNGSDYNWIINTDGSATFKSITLKTDVHISGVQNGSKFGDNFGVNSSGNLWGKFSDSVGSIFASSASEPFEGKCVDHIKTLALKKLEAEWIDGDYIKADLLTADNIKAGTLSADRIAAKSITGAKIAAGTITGDKIAAGTIDADKLSVKYMTAKQVSAEISQTLKSWDGELHCATFYADGQGPWKYRVIVDGDGNSVSVLAL